MVEAKESLNYKTTDVDDRPKNTERKEAASLDLCRYVTANCCLLFLFLHIEYLASCSTRLTLSLRRPGTSGGQILLPFLFRSPYLFLILICLQYSRGTVRGISIEMLKRVSVYNQSLSNYRLLRVYSSRGYTCTLCNSNKGLKVTLETESRAENILTTRSKAFLSSILGNLEISEVRYIFESKGTRTRSREHKDENLLVRLARTTVHRAVRSVLGCPSPSPF